MKLIKIVYAVYLFIMLVSIHSCTQSEWNDDVGLSSKSSITFSFNTLVGDIIETRNVPNNTNIVSLEYMILDAAGIEIVPQWQYLNGTSSLTIERIEDGNYTLVVYACVTENPSAIPVKENNSYVLTNPNPAQPIEDEYLFAKVDFEVSKEEASRAIPVLLSRCVGAVELNVIVEGNPYMQHQITGVTFTINEEDCVYTSYSTLEDNLFSGTGSLADQDMTTKRYFLSLPSNKPLSGSVVIQSISYNGDFEEKEYLFENLVIDAGKTTTLDIKWRTADSNNGYFKITEDHYNVDNYSELFADDEPREVIYNQKLRYFYTNEPLQLRVTDDKKLQVKLYAPVELTDVTIMCRFLKYSPDFVKFAHFEVIHGFSELNLPIPIAEQSFTYESEDGRRVVIPAMSNFSTGDYEFKIVVSHPYMDKIRTITKPMHVTIGKFSADNSTTSWTHMTPEICKQACVLTVNLSYMFNSQLFEDMANAWPRSSLSSSSADSLRGNNGVALQPIVIINAARNVSRINCGAVHGGDGVIGLGGGSTFGVTPSIYRGQYWYGANINNIKAGNAIIHEFGHCMGYGHSSSIAGGDAFVRLGQEVLCIQSNNGSLPIAQSNWALNYP